MSITSTLFRIGCIFGFALLVAGCVTKDVVKSPEANAVVRRVDFRKAPELQELAEHARQFGNAMYPEVCALFAVAGAQPPRRFDIILKPFNSLRSGETFVELRRIVVNSMYLTNNLNRQEDFDKVLVHEMTHMALQHNAYRWSRPHYGWEEGLANYAYYKPIGTNGLACPQCDSIYPHYSSGYTCAGAFLLYVESRFGTNVIRQLTAELQHRRYTDAFFGKTTGQSFAALWADFQKTAAFKPGAPEAFALQQELGFVGNDPPKNAVTRFNKYLEQHADEVTRRAVKSFKVEGRLMEDVRILIAAYLYFTQPHGSAEKAWLDLREKGAVPGIVKGEKGSLSAFLRYDEIVSQNYPLSRTLAVGKRGDPAIYHYTMVRAMAESDWKLTKAWRADAGGKVIEEFPVP